MPDALAAHSTPAVADDLSHGGIPLSPRTSLRTFFFGEPATIIKVMVNLP